MSLSNALDSIPDGTHRLQSVAGNAVVEAAAATANSIASVPRSGPNFSPDNTHSISSTSTNSTSASSVSTGATSNSSTSGGGGASSVGSTSTLSSNTTSGSSNSTGNNNNGTNTATTTPTGHSVASNSLSPFAAPNNFSNVRYSPQTHSLPQMQQQAYAQMNIGMPLVNYRLTAPPTPMSMSMSMAMPQQKPLPYGSSMVYMHPSGVDAQQPQQQQQDDTTSIPSSSQTGRSQVSGSSPRDAAAQQSFNSAYTSSSSAMNDAAGYYFLKSSSSPSSSHKKEQSTTLVPKRPRRKFHEIERIYACSYPECTKAYGTLNHLNAHITMQNHGERRLPGEFKELRKQWKLRKKMEAEANANASRGGAGSSVMMNSAANYDTSNNNQEHLLRSYNPGSIYGYNSAPMMYNYQAPPQMASQMSSQIPVTQGHSTPGYVMTNYSGGNYAAGNYSRNNGSVAQAQAQSHYMPPSDQRYTNMYNNSENNHQYKTSPGTSPPLNTSMNNANTQGPNVTPNLASGMMPGLAPGFVPTTGPSQGGGPSQVANANQAAMGQMHMQTHMQAQMQNPVLPMPHLAAQQSTGPNASQYYMPYDYYKDA